MRYETAAGFREALLSRLRHQAKTHGVSVEAGRKRVVFERLLARLVEVAPGRWALKGALALDFRLPVHARATKDADLVVKADVEWLTEELLAAALFDLGDHFVFRVRRARDVDHEQPEPTVRFHVTAEVAGQPLDEATMDVSMNTYHEWHPEFVTSHLLEFAGLPPAQIPVIPPEAHVAEKIHAYTRSYGGTGERSTRSKDLVDLVVIVETLSLDAASLRADLRRVFEQRNTHPLPTALPAPPMDWTVPYRTASEAVRVAPDLAGGHRKVAACVDPVLGGSVTTGRWDPASGRWQP